MVLCKLVRRNHDRKSLVSIGHLNLHSFKERMVSIPAWHITSRGNNQYRYQWFNEKTFLEVIVLLSIPVSYRKKKKLSRSCKWGRPWDVYGTQLRDVSWSSDKTFWVRPRDVGQACFLNSAHKRIKPTLTGYSKL